MIASRMRRRDEEGSALIIALAMMLILALVMTQLMSFLDVGLKSSRVMQERAALSAAADGAMDAAVNRFLNHGGACDDYPAPALASSGAPVNGEDMIVRCEEVILPAGGSANKPANALLSLGDVVGEPGISAADNSNLRVRGDVFSRSTIEAGTSGGIVAEGNVSALDDCLGTIQTIGEDTAVKCANRPPTADPARGRDPSYIKAASVLPRWRQVPSTCPGGNRVVPLEPGYYDDAAALTALTSCTDVVVWLKPGNYYFDFSFVGGAPQTWTINNPAANVVGGREKGWDPTAPARPTIPSPGACKVEGDAGPVEGVQIILGGESSVEVLNGKVEVCAPAHDDDQQIALYGLPPSPAGDVRALYPIATADDVNFQDPDNALDIGELPVTIDPPAAPSAVARAQLTSEADEASLLLTQFRPRIPANAVISATKLRVVHQEDGDIDSVRATVTLSDPAGTTIEFASDDAACPSAVELCTAASLAEGNDVITIPGDLAPADLENATVKYEAFGGGGDATADLDGMALEVTYREPENRKPTETTAVTAFTATQEAIEMDGTSASANLLSGGPTSASITLEGFADPPLPVGATVDSAVLRVAHREVGEVGAVSVTANLPTAACTRPLAESPDGTEEPVDIKLFCPAGAFDGDEDLNGLTFTYNVALEPGGTAATASLDGIRLDLLYTAPAPSLPTTATAASAASTTFAPTTNALTINGADANVTLTPEGATRASIDLSNFGSGIPVGSLVESAVLRVAHREQGDIDPAELRLTPTFAGSTCENGVILTPQAALSPPEVVDIKEECGFDGAEDLSDITVTYEAALTGTGTTAEAALDGVELVVTFRPYIDRPPAVAVSSTFDPADNAKDINGDSATVDLGVNPSASIDLSEYGPALPPGSVVESVRLRIAHKEQGDPSTVTVEASCGSGPVELDPTKSIDDEHVVVLAGCLASDFDDFNVTFTAALDDGGASGTATLDGIELELIFRTPRFRPLEAVMATGPYVQGTPSGNVAVLKATGGPQTRFIIQGTVYAPTAAVDVSLSGVNTQVITRGVIARTIQLGITPAVGFQRATTAVPPEAVRFEAYPRRTRVADTATGTGWTVPSIRLPAEAASPAVPGALSFAPAGGGRVISDSATADAVLDGVTTPANIAIADYGATLAPGAVIHSATVRVKYQHDGDVVAATFTASSSAGTCDPAPVPLATGLGLREHDFSLLPCLATIPDLLTDPGFSVTYEVTGGGGVASAKLDGIELDLASPDNGRLIDGRAAGSTLTGSGSGTEAASLTLAGFQRSAGQRELADGAPIDEAVLRVAHQDHENVKLVEVTVEFAGGESRTYNSDGTGVGGDIPVGSPPGDPPPCKLCRHKATDGIVTDTIVLAGVTAGQLASATVTYEVQLLLSAGETGTAYLDGMSIDIFSGPLLRSRVSFGPAGADVEGWSVLRE